MARVNPVSRKGCQYIQSVSPLAPENGDTWFDVENNKIKIYDQANLKWISSEEIVFSQNGYGYFCGGSDGSNLISTVDRFEFPFNSGNAIHTGNLKYTRFWSCGFNSSMYGYVCGGSSSSNSSNQTSTIQRFKFPFDSGTASHVGNLSMVHYVSSGYNSSQYGYVCGGQNGATYLSSIERITFPFDSGTASHVGNLTMIKNYLACCNSSQYGYICGGQNSTTYYSSVERITFPFNSGTASHVGNLSGSFKSKACNSTGYGYICGGYNGTNRSSSVERITFPFNSGTASHVSNLSGTKYPGDAIDNTDFVSQGLFI
jgi:hypothetical protein